MIITVHTLFPDLIDGYRREGILARAERDGRLTIRTRDLRRFAGNRSGRVDDAPYGGGAGMVIRVDVAAAALAVARSERPAPDRVVLLSPAGPTLDQERIRQFAQLEHLVLLSGRYEGFDARTEALVDEEASIGDYVLMGGELPALVVIEAVARLLPGVLGAEASHRDDSFASGLLDWPEYTRPPVFADMAVPEVLLSGHHGKVAAWRRRQALARTLQRRPDLLERAPLSDEDRRLLAELRDAHEVRAAPDAHDAQPSAMDGDDQSDG